MILLDTSILIDYYRSKNKINTKLVRLSNEHSFGISIVTKFEFLSGTKPDKLAYTLSIIQNMEKFILDESCIDIAIQLYNELKIKNQLIEIPDIFIASTSIRYDIPIATLNKSHFSRITNLNILD